MATRAGFTEQGIDAITAAIFDRHDAWVVEAYSEFDSLPRQFGSADELSQYAKKKLGKRRGMVHCFVVYPDMCGQVVRRKIKIKSQHASDPKVRYTWDGWGMISLIIQRRDEQVNISGFSANSEARAWEWQATEPQRDPPSAWNWKAVASHVRRLQRVFKRSA